MRIETFLSTKLIFVVRQKRVLSTIAFFGYKPVSRRGIFCGRGANCRLGPFCRLAPFYGLGPSYRLAPFRRLGPICRFDERSLDTGRSSKTVRRGGVMGRHLRADVGWEREPSDSSVAGAASKVQPRGEGIRPGRRTRPPETRPLTVLDGLNDPQHSEGHRP
jgi:hypothetical protein